MITARNITAVMRELLPLVKPLRTSTIVSSEGLVLGWEITLPQGAARNVSATRLADTAELSGYLSRHLGRAMHIADVYGTRRRDYSTLVHLVLRTGPAEG